MTIINQEPIVESATLLKPADETFRVLIMDSVIHTDRLKAACKSAGHNVIGVQTISDAFVFLDGEDHADVIVCAAYLEDESLFEFLKRLRESAGHSHSRFMILSLEPTSAGKKANLSTEVAGRVLGADAFVSMPVFDANQLIAEIKKLLPLMPALKVSRDAGELD